MSVGIPNDKILFQNGGQFNYLKYTIQGGPELLLTIFLGKTTY